MSLGQRAILTVPPEFAYGQAGIPGIIGPDAVLKFDVEILRID